MKTENTNDFSKCKIGDKLWSIQFGECVVKGIFPNQIIVMSEYDFGCWSYQLNGCFNRKDKQQSLFFSNPNIIAPPEPPRLPDYKPGQWIAVWDVGLPSLRKFVTFDSGRCIAEPGSSWQNHCTLEELPEVLAKWGEKK